MLITALIYCFPQVMLPTYAPLARRFAESYCANPPGVTDHELYVVLNGGSEVGPYQRDRFKPLAPQFLTHNNFGKDLGAYQYAAEIIPADLFVFMGAHTNFVRPGWLDRIIEVVEQNGPALYGLWGFDSPRPHLRTTFFFCPSELFRAYPYQISDRMRYEAEHGANSLTLWSKQVGFETYMVTWNEVLPFGRWRNIGPEESLVLDQHYERAGHFWKA